MRKERCLALETLNPTLLHPLSSDFSPSSLPALHVFVIRHATNEMLLSRNDTELLSCIDSFLSRLVLLRGCVGVIWVLIWLSSFCPHFENAINAIFGLKTGGCWFFWAGVGGELRFIVRAVSGQFCCTFVCVARFDRKSHLLTQPCLTTQGPGSIVNRLWWHSVSDPVVTYVRKDCIPTA
ncbi:hypothetical protein BDW62DRAFT_49817 [Aspergillus aurantiobrunneus]